MRRYPQRATRPPVRYGQYVGAATRLAYRAYRSYTGTRKSVTSGSGVTAQYDKKTQYVKRRMPYRRRKRWVRFSRKVAAVMQKDIATRTVVYNGLVTTTGDIANNATDQGVAEVMLYGFKGDTDAFYIQGARDIQTLLTTLQLSEITKIRMKSAVLDLTARAINQPVELDVYEVICNKSTTYTTLKSAVVQGFLDTPTPVGGTTGLTLVRRGVTLFDCPKAIKATGMKIVKKTKYFLPAGNTMTYQIRDPKNRYMNIGAVSTAAEPGFNLRGYTRVVFFVWKALPGVTGDPAQLLIGATRKYAYTVLENNQEEDKYGA